MNQRYLLSILAIAGAVFATSGCVATASDGGYYNNSGPMYGGYGSDYGRPNNSVYVQDNYGDNRYYRDRDQNRDRQAWERDRDRDARDRDARERDRQQRARDDDRRRELERQQRDRNNNRDAYGNDALKKQGDILLNATTFRFDGSDLMPGKIGAGAFWTGMVDYAGGKSAQEVGDQIQKDWDAIK